MIERFDGVKRLILPKVSYRFKAIPFKIPLGHFRETDNSKIYMELQKMEKSKNREKNFKDLHQLIATYNKDSVEFAFNLQ